MATFKDRTSKVKVDAVRIEGFGKDFLKTKKLSPDAMMQLSFQVYYVNSIQNILVLNFV